MVMLKHNIPLIPQEIIGYYLGLIVPQEEAKYFWNARVGKEPKSGYGTQIQKKQYEPNTAFKKLKIPLKMSYKFINEFKSLDAFKKYLSAIQKGGKDILACFDYGSLYNTDYHGGHVCVIDKIYLKKDEIRLIDPERNVPKWRLVNIETLFFSMKKHGKQRSGGFWELTRK
jgi:hypothetical protein